jgi:hypothetical protein
MSPPANVKVTGTTEKRGRGRPRKPDAMSNAERQAAWRARHGARTKSVTVTKNIPPPADAHDALVSECEQLGGELARARRELEAVSRATPSGRAPSDVAAVLGRLPRQEDADSGERRLHLAMTGKRSQPAACAARAKPSSLRSHGPRSASVFIAAISHRSISPATRARCSSSILPSCAASPSNAFSIASRSASCSIASPCAGCTGYSDFLSHAL